MAHQVRIGKFVAGGGRPLFLIAGPCVIESERHALKMATRLAAAARRVGIPFIFKTSYDKANRTSLDSYRGPGLLQGLKILGRIKTKLGVPILTDVHEVAHVGPAAEVCAAKRKTKNGGRCSWRGGPVRWSTSRKVSSSLPGICATRFRKSRRRVITAF